ncbi:MAG: TauD/TfdA family dioxygenase, partial [Actinomycetota bacterium]
MDADPNGRAGVEVVPVTASIGAEIRGLDLRDLDDERFEVLRDAVHQHGVAFVRDAHLDEDEHLDLGRRFGALRTFELFAVNGVTDPTLT